MDRSFSSLRTLRVCIQSWTGAYDVTDLTEAEHERCRQLLYGFSIFLRDAPHLETLETSCEIFTPKRNISKYIFFAVYQAAMVYGGLINLRVLELEEVHIDFPGLLQFVETVSRSLTCLRVRCSKLYRVASVDLNVESEIRAAAGREDFTVDMADVKLRQESSCVVYQQPPTPEDDSNTGVQPSLAE